MVQGLPVSASRTSRLKLIAAAALAAIPLTAACLWWITPAAKPPDTTTEDHMRQVRAAAAGSVPLARGAPVTLPRVEQWLNPQTSEPSLDHRLTVLDFTTLW